MSKQVKTFLIITMVMAAMICVGECVMLRKAPEAAHHYGAYLIFLPAASLGGAFVISMLTWFLTQKDEAEARMAKIRIGELERTLHDLEDVSERREQFIASFAHELKTPLTAIIGYADMLRSKDMPPKQRFTAAGYIFSEGKRLEALSLKLMDIIVAGKQEFEKRRYDAGYFIREVATVTVPSLSADGMTLDMRWDQGEVEIEPDLFKTLMINLVDNARKAGKRGQNIELFGKQEPGGYAFYVKDYGRGMKQEELARITEPFYMIDKSRSRAQNGAGLGLALCQRIAELHGTRLEYQSELGAGTTVRVFLPGGEKT
jgi:signal transduction histidine kinase